MQVRPIPGLEQLPWAEVWFHEVDDERWRAASEAARAIGKDGLEVWTTDRTPEVAVFFEERGYEEVRRYYLTALDVAAAPDPGEPELPLVTLAERPDLLSELYALAQVAYADQPGRDGTRIPPFDVWRTWFDGQPHDACFIALDGERVLGYGFLTVDGDTGKHGFTGVARDARRAGVGTAIKRAQIAWAKANGLRRLETATEARLDGMRRLNQRYGYRPLYAEIILRGPLAP